jgi:hypothetical protein
LKASSGRDQGLQGRFFHSFGLARRWGSRSDVNGLGLLTFLFTHESRTNPAPDTPNPKHVFARAFEAVFETRILVEEEVILES